MWSQRPCSITHPSMCVCVCVDLQEKADLGELNFSLCYLPTAGRLTATVIKATNLKAMDLTGFSGKGLMPPVWPEAHLEHKSSTTQPEHCSEMMHVDVWVKLVQQAEFQPQRTRMQCTCIIQCAVFGLRNVAFLVFMNVFLSLQVKSTGLRKKY